MMKGKGKPMIKHQSHKNSE